MHNDFPMYTPQYISGVMSLRKPQKKSLEILEDILNNVELKKGMNLDSALETVNKLYPTCTNFERDFMSLTFALATGVGKTRLMGAFITYLYTKYNIRNFFVVAYNTTIYDKLQRDLGDPNNPKYVFKGLSCFPNPPEIITGDDFRGKPLPSFQSKVRIFVYNISKFDSKDTTMRRKNDYYETSFFGDLAALSDLVLLMDESHHYHGEVGEQALNELKPLLGLELTATPLTNKKSKGQQIPFKNVVYEYPLSRAIADGYTRTPFLVTRPDASFFNFGDEQIDKLMLQDGIYCHEDIKVKLQAYAENNGKPVIKPFMLIVCKDTAHAQRVEGYVKSDEFRDGAYRSKVIIVHSKQGKAESDANTRLLLEVERADNPIEIVIHVDKLKEGWDVNNLFTIVPLRTAASKILREQMVGRGLRLPYGERTGDSAVDSVMLTAHDKFNDIIAEAQKGDSIFKAGNVIKIEDTQPEQLSGVQLALPTEPDEVLASAYEATGIERNDETDEAIQELHTELRRAVDDAIQNAPHHVVSAPEIQQIAKAAVQKIEEKRDLAAVYHEESTPAVLRDWAEQEAEKIHIAAIEKFIPIPRIRVTDLGAEEYVFLPFELDLNAFNHQPLSDELLIQNLQNRAEPERIKAGYIDFEGYKPKSVILAELREKPEIDYNKCGELVRSLITAVIDHYENEHGENGMRSIVMMYRIEIGNLIYKQMMQHFYCENGFIQEEVLDESTVNLKPSYTHRTTCDLFDDDYQGDIRSVLFTGIKRGVFSEIKVDSHDGELTFARLVERDKDVINWLRPAPRQFNITYNHGRNYEPDFVVETDDTIYLVEVKQEDKINDPDVIAKKKRGIQYCQTVTRWSEANGRKPWKYLFIPSKQVLPNATFQMIVKRFVVDE